MRFQHNKYTVPNSERQPVVERWLDTLRLVSRRPPLDLAHHDGVDLTRPEPLRRVVAWFGELVDELGRSFA